MSNDGAKFLLAMSIVEETKAEKTIVDTFKSVAKMLEDSNPKGAYEVMKMVANVDFIKQAIAKSYAELPIECLSKVEDFYSSDAWKQFSEHSTKHSPALVEKWFKDSGIEL